MKCTFNSYNIRKFTNCKFLMNSSVLASNNNTFECLYTFSRSLNNFYINSYCISCTEAWMKIGRASCRERVEISVVEVSLKKKTTEGHSEQRMVKDKDM